MKQRDLGWLEGLIDSEGALVMSSKTDKIHYNYVCVIGNTNRRFLLRAQKLIGGKVYSSRILKSGKIFSVLMLHPNALRKLLPKIRLIVKERQRVLLIEALNLSAERGRGARWHPTLNLERLQEIFKEMRQLNRRGSKR